MAIFNVGRAALRRAFVCAALTIVFLGGFATSHARAEDRTLHLYFTHTKETIRVTYKRNGRFDQDSLNKLNRFLRDWRQDKSVKMDPELFDILWEVYRQTNASGPIHIVSAYRSPQTNAALRSRSRQVAKTSQHMRGKAIDFFIPGVNMAKVREVGLKMQRGGVGWYPSSASHFVHLDTGSVRHWPRMSRQQLARVFPDGKTVHVPTDGKPMPRYADAARELARAGKAPSAVAQQYASASGVKTARSSSSSGRAMASLDGDRDPNRALRPQNNKLLSFLFGDDEDAAAETAAAEGSDAPETASEPVAVTPTQTVELPAAPVPPASQQTAQPAPQQLIAEAAPALPPVPLFEPGAAPQITLAEAPMPHRNPFAPAEPASAPALAAALPPVGKPRVADEPSQTQMAALEPPVDLSKTGRGAPAAADSFDKAALIAYAQDGTPADRIEALLREEAGLSMMQSGRGSLAALSNQSQYEGYEWLNRSTGTSPELVAQNANWRFISPSRHRSIDRASVFAEADLSFRLMRLDSPLTEAPKWVMMQGFSFDNDMMDVGRFSGTAVQALRLKGPFEPRRTTTASLQQP